LKVRWPNLLRGQDPDAEAPGGWRTGRVALLGACGLGLAVILANAIANPAPAPEEEAKEAAASTASWAPKSLAAYTLRPEPEPEPQPAPEPPPAPGDPLPLSSAAAPLQPAPPPEALIAAATGHIGVWPAQATQGAPATHGTSAAMDTAAPAVTGGAASGCVIAAGTVVPAQLVTAASSDYAGAVIARVARDVLGADGCLGIQAGSTLVGEMGRARDFGQERGEVVFEALHTLDGRQVDLASAAGDALGMGGVPGEANLHTGTKALRVAIATAVDLGSAYLGGRGDGLNILLGHGGRAIDEWTRQALERKPSITLDPLKQPVTLTVIITRPITL
jgi:type IV secretory pathway VirB10-like protein